MIKNDPWSYEKEKKFEYLFWMIWKVKTEISHTTYVEAILVIFAKPDLDYLYKILLADLVTHIEKRRVKFIHNHNRSMYVRGS